MVISTPLEQLKGLIGRIKYKPGWSIGIFKFVPNVEFPNFSEVTLRVTIPSIDPQNPPQKRNTSHDVSIMMAYFDDEENAVAQIYEIIGEVEKHEQNLWFSYCGQKPYDSARDPLDTQMARTAFFNKRREKEQQ